MFRATLCSLALATGVIATSHANEATISLEIPRLNVAEYHRPYVAVWAREDDTGDITNLALWYQIDDKGEGEKWLKDLRQWWRRSGRSLEMPADGLTGATRKPGNHSIDVAQTFEALPAGDYTLYVEASREVGGRELLELPFSLPATAPVTVEANGDSELGAVVLHIKP